REDGGELYDRLGVGAFARLPLVRSSPKLALRSRDQLPAFVRACRAAEASHVVAFAVVAACAGVLSLFDVARGGWTLASNVVPHVPAVLLQRRNRGRVAKILETHPSYARRAPFASA